MESSQQDGGDNKPTKDSTMNQHTNNEIATSHALWVEYVNADGTITRAEFDAMSTEQKLALVEAAFGSDQE